MEHDAGVRCVVYHNMLSVFALCMFLPRGGIMALRTMRENTHHHRWHHLRSRTAGALFFCGGASVVCRKNSGGALNRTTSATSGCCAWYDVIRDRTSGYQASTPTDARWERAASSARRRRVAALRVCIVLALAQLTLPPRASTRRSGGLRAFSQATTTPLRVGTLLCAHFLAPPRHRVGGGDECSGGRKASLPPSFRRHKRQTDKALKQAARQRQRLRITVT